VLKTPRRWARLGADHEGPLFYCRKAAKQAGRPRSTATITTRSKEGYENTGTAGPGGVSLFKVVHHRSQSNTRKEGWGHNLEQAAFILSSLPDMVIAKGPETSIIRRQVRHGNRVEDLRPRVVGMTTGVSGVGSRKKVIQTSTLLRRHLGGRGSIVATRDQRFTPTTCRKTLAGTVGHRST